MSRSRRTDTSLANRMGTDALDEETDQQKVVRGKGCLPRTWFLPRRTRRPAILVHGKVEEVLQQEKISRIIESKTSGNYLA